MTQMQVQLNAEQLQQLEQQAKSQGLSPQEHLDQLIARALEPRERRLKRATQHVLAKNKELYERLS